MRKLFLKSAVLALAGVGLLAGNVLATVIDFDVAGAPDSSVNTTHLDTWLSTDVTLEMNSNLDSIFFSLDEGQSKTFDFFTATVTGTGIGYAEIEATLGFDAPAISASGSASGGWMTLWGTVSAGGLTWDDSSVPDYFVYNDQLISVDFNDVLKYGVGNKAIISATVKNMGTAPVPEPATMLLFGTGLAGLAGVVRKKKIW